MAAGHVVVVVGEGPVDELRTTTGHGGGHRASRTQDPGQLAHGPLVVGDVLEDLGGDDPVEGSVREGQRQGVTPDRTDPGRAGSSSPASAMAPNVSVTWRTSSAPAS